jgi:hypothetical protein
VSRRTLTRVGIAIFIALGVLVALVLIVRGLDGDEVTEEDASPPAPGPSALSAA